MADYKDTWKFTFEVAGSDGAVASLTAVGGAADTAAGHLETLAAAWQKLIAVARTMPSNPLAAIGAQQAAQQQAGAGVIQPTATAGNAAANIPRTTSEPVDLSALTTRYRQYADEWDNANNLMRRSTTTWAQDVSGQWLRVGDSLAKGGQLINRTGYEYERFGDSVRLVKTSTKDFAEGMSFVEEATKRIGDTATKTTTEFTRLGGAWRETKRTIADADTGEVLSQRTQKWERLPSGEYRAIASELDEVAAASGRARTGFDHLKMRISTLAEWFAFYEAIHMIGQAIGDWGKVQREMSLQLAQYEMALGGSTSAMREYLQVASTISAQTGINPAEVAEGVTLQRRVPGAPGDLAYQSAMVQRVAPGVDNIAAQRTLLSITQQFAQDGKTTTEILDAMSGAWSKSALSMGEFFAMMDTAGPTSREYNTTLENMMGLIAGVSTVANSGTGSIEQFVRRMSSVYTDERFRGAIEKYTGPVEKVDLQTGEIMRRPIEDIFRDISKLPTEQIQEIASTIQNQLGQPTPLIFLNMIEAWGNIEQAISQANDAVGKFGQNSMIAMDTFAARTDAVGAAWQRLLQNFGDTGFVEGILVGLHNRLEQLTGLINPDYQPQINVVNPQRPIAVGPYTPIGGLGDKYKTDEELGIKPSVQPATPIPLTTIVQPTPVQQPLAMPIPQPTGVAASTLAFAGMLPDIRLSGPPVASGPYTPMGGLAGRYVTDEQAARGAYTGPLQPGDSGRNNWGPLWQAPPLGPTRPSWAEQETKPLAPYYGSQMGTPLPSDIISSGGASFDKVIEEYNRLLERKLESIANTRTKGGDLLYPNVTDPNVLKRIGGIEDTRVGVYDEMNNRIVVTTGNIELLGEAANNVAQRISSLEFGNMPKNVGVADVEAAKARAIGTVDAAYAEQYRKYPESAPAPGGPVISRDVMMLGEGGPVSVNLSSDNLEKLGAYESVFKMYLSDASTANTQLISKAEEQKGILERIAKSAEGWAAGLLAKTPVTPTELAQGEMGMKGEPTGPVALHWDEPIRRAQAAVDARAADKGGTQLYNRGDEKDPAIRGNWGYYAQGLGIDTTNKATAMSSMEELERRYYSGNMPGGRAYYEAPNEAIGGKSPMDALIIQAKQKMEEETGRQNLSRWLVEDAQKQGVDIPGYVAKEITGQTGQFDKAFWGAGGETGAGERVKSGVRTIMPKIDTAIVTGIGQIDVAGAIAVVPIDLADERLVNLGAQIGAAIRSGVYGDITANLVDDIVAAVIAHFEKEQGK